ncbi:MAG: hypothetical protein J1D77_00815 [Muribaculaceae bacterium]|nr:hypothetical protein [Muribaculaceae bacterium]
MKKLVYALLALAFLMPAAASAKTPLEKAREKAYKEKLKEYKKEGWKPLGSKTLELVLLEHYDNLGKLGPNGHEVEGVSTRTKSINTGKQMAINNAVVTYGQEAGSTLQGRVISDMSANGASTDGEFENFFAAYERLVEREIRNEMQPSFTIMKDNGDGSYEIRTYFIVEENAARKARLRALEDAMKESQIAAEHADKISDFVRQGFDE